MKLLTIYNAEGSVKVEYVTDLITDKQSNFTVMEIRGLDEAEQKLGISFQKLNYSVEIFKEFCSNNQLGLKARYIGSTIPSAEEILVEAPEPEPDPEPEIGE